MVNGELAIVIPLEAGGTVLASLAKGIAEIDGEFLKIVIQPWLAEKLRIGVGSLVIVDNVYGKLTITRSGVNEEPSQGPQVQRVEDRPWIPSSHTPKR